MCKSILGRMLLVCFMVGISVINGWADDKDEFLNRLKEEYRKYTEKYQDPATGLLYGATMDELREERNNTVEDVLKGMVRGQSAPHGYGPPGPDSGINDTSLFTGQMLYSMLEAYDVRKDPEIEAWARLLFNGMKTIGMTSPVPGFIPRGPHPNNRQAYYKDSSMDQHSTYVLAMWSYYNSPLATDEDKAFIRDSLDKVAKRLEKNNWRILWEDDSQEAWAGGGDLIAFNSEAVTLIVLFVGAAADVTGDKHWKDTYEAFAAEKEGMRWKVLMPGDPGFRTNPHPQWCQQTIFRAHCLYNIEKDPSRRDTLLTHVKTATENRMAMQFPPQTDDGEWVFKAFNPLTLTPEEAEKVGWKQGYCENAISAWNQFPQNYKELPDALRTKINNICIMYTSSVFAMGVFSRDAGLEAAVTPSIMDMIDKIDLACLWAWPRWGVIVPGWKAYAVYCSQP